MTGVTRQIRAQMLSETFPAVPASVPQARHAVERFAEAAGMTGDDLDSLRLAVSEAISNVVRHAYRSGEEGAIHVLAAIAGDELWVLIGDDGHGLQAVSDDPGLGVGLALIASVSDHFAVINRSGGGTELRMRFQLARLPRRLARPARHRRGSVASA